MPTLKRITLRSVSQLQAWIARGEPMPDAVMLVTNASSTIGTDEIASALAGSGWHAGRRFTLPAGQIGYVISR